MQQIKSPQQVNATNFALIWWEHYSFNIVKMVEKSLKELNSQKKHLAASLVNCLEVSGSRKYSTPEQNFSTFLTLRWFYTVSCLSIFTLIQANSH